MNKASSFFGSLVLVAAITSCGGNKKQGPDPNAARPFPVVEVQERSVTGYTSYPTSIEGRINNDVRAKISGYIREVLVDEGQPVRKGQVLFRLETNNLSEVASAARSGIGAAEANVTAAEAAVSSAQLEVNKLIPLVEKNIISSVQLQTAKDNLRSAEGKLAQAKAGQSQAQANYKSALANVDYSIIRSPIDGIVGRIPFKTGSLVGPSDPTPLTTVSETSEVYAYFSMNESEYLNFLGNTPGNTVAEKLRNIPPVTLVLANGREYDHKGLVKTVTGQIDPQTGSILFRASFPNQSGLLVNGNSGTIRIPKQYKNVLVVPEAATFEQQGIVHLFVADHDTTVLGTIKVIDRVNNLVLVESGINKGDLVIAAGVNSLRSGMKIIPRKTDLDSIVNAIKPVFER